MAAEPASCSKCNRAMSARAVVCPHCGARQPDRDPVVPALRAERPAPPARTARDAPARPNLAGIEMSREEVAALLAIDDAARPRPTDGEQKQSAFAMLLLPSDATRGTARWIELLCTLVALPQIVSVGLVLIVPGRYLHRRAIKVRAGDIQVALLASVMGSLGAIGLAQTVGWPLLPVLIVCGVGTVALFARAGIRLRAIHRSELT